MKTNIAKLDLLVAKHRLNNKIISTAKLNFLGVDGYDVYNISGAFVYNNKKYIAGRVEKRDSEISFVAFFERIDENIYQVTPYRIDNFQDPIVNFVDGQLLVGGTKIFPNKQNVIDSWQTVFYQGSSFDELTEIIVAPLKMKDVRIAQDGQTIHMMSRPQGGVARYGKIGYAQAKTLQDITTLFIEQAPLIDDLFGDDTWGGANEIHPLKNGWLAVLGHVAKMSEGLVRHYYGMTFAYHPVLNKCTEMKIICERKDFPPGPSKRDDLVDVVFVGGIVRHGNNLATVYTGLSDAEAYYAIMEDPFTEYERL